MQIVVLKEIEQMLSELEEEKVKHWICNKGKESAKEFILFYESRNILRYTESRSETTYDSEPCNDTSLQYFQNCYAKSRDLNEFMIGVNKGGKYHTQSHTIVETRIKQRREYFDYIERRVKVQRRGGRHYTIAKEKYGSSEAICSFGQRGEARREFKRGRVENRIINLFNIVEKDLKREEIQIKIEEEHSWVTVMYQDGNYCRIFK